MKKIKFLLLAVVMVFASVFIATPANVSASEQLGQTIVFVQVPADWESPGIWAWGSAGGGLWDHLGWPGQPMQQDPNNPGWYFQWMASDMTGGLVNANEGSIQTNDFTLTGQPIWVTVTGEGDAFSYTTTPQTTGEFPSATTPIFAQVPAGWEAPRVWAWGGADSPYFAAWPGTAQMLPVPNNEGWFFFHAPGDMTGGLISANEGSIQTSDFPLEGQPIWVTISGEGDDFTVATTPQTTGAVPQMHTIIYVQVPAGWDAPGIWAWGSVQGGLWDHLGWPGQPMQECPHNPGWFFQYVATDMTGGLVNANDGGIQTNDFTLTGQPIWVTVTGEGDDFTFTTTPQTTGAFAPFFPPAPVADEGMVEIEAILIYAYVPERWMPGFWGWGPRGNLYDGDFPGPAMTADPNNPGWFYTFIPADTAGIIVNEGIYGAAQTTNINFSNYGVPLWIIITDEDTEEGATDGFTVHTERQTYGPLPTSGPFVFGAPEEIDAPDVANITVRAIVPDDWAQPGLWAWSDVVGANNAGPGGAWPGPSFVDRDGDWWVMEAPGWVEYIIINADAGSTQTEDLPVEVGRDIWIVVMNAIEVDLRHEAFDPADAAAAERPEPVVFAPTATPTPPPTQAAAPADEGGANVVLIIVIVTTVVAVVLAGVFVILKKKK
ncbi:MAG: starch-binding protein [Defluviitaleaceae bacterium]|nr:starch-binding protein [Defluviitaleaceae bacterium]MCL2274921.1 starch-binding protein [Defluviitaleaceae bacterium]